MSSLLERQHVAAVLAGQRFRQRSKMNRCSLHYGASWWRITEPLL
jgi:hypothetical protein